MSKTAELAIVGTLANPPEQLRSGVALHVSVADLAKEDGKPAAAWVRCTAFGDLAEVALATFNRGDQIYLRGRPTIDRWQDRYTGQPKSGLSLIVEEATKIGVVMRPPKSEQPKPTEQKPARARPKTADLPMGLPKTPARWNEIRIQREEPRPGNWQEPLDWERGDSLADVFE